MIYTVMRTIQRVYKVIAITVNTMIRNAGDKVSASAYESLWVGPRCGGGGVGSCGSRLCLRDTGSFCTGGVVGPAEVEGRGWSHISS